MIVKAILLTFDLATNALLLYQTLVTKGQDLFMFDRMMAILLSVICPSAVVIVCINVLVNLPLHFAYLRMQLKGKISDNGDLGDEVGICRVLRKAMSRTFHPLAIGVCGMYATYSLWGYYFLVTKLKEAPISSTDDAFSTSIIPRSEFFSDFSTSEVGIAVYFNWAANYFVGVVASVAYWLWHMLWNGLRLDKCAHCV